MLKLEDPIGGAGKRSYESSFQRVPAVMECVGGTGNLEEIDSTLSNIGDLVNAKKKDLREVLDKSDEEKDVINGAKISVGELAFALNNFVATPKSTVQNGLLAHELGRDVHFNDISNKVECFRRNDYRKILFLFDFLEENISDKGVISYLNYLNDRRNTLQSGSGIIKEGNNLKPLLDTFYDNSKTEDFVSFSVDLTYAAFLKKEGGINKWTVNEAYSGFKSLKRLREEGVFDKKDEEVKENKETDISPDYIDVELVVPFIGAGNNDFNPNEKSMQA